MSVRLVVTFAVILAFLSSSTFAGASPSPSLTAIAMRGGHAVVSVRFPSGERPYDVEVSKSSRLTEAGFAGTLVIRELLPAASGGTLRYRMHRRLAPGRYWVAVSAQDVDGVDCVPVRAKEPCLLEWSNVRSLRVR